MGEHDKDRHYAMWPLDQIDHIHMEEEKHWDVTAPVTIVLMQNYVPEVHIVGVPFA